MTRHVFFLNYYSCGGIIASLGNALGMKSIRSSRVLIEEWGAISGVI